MKDPAFRVAVLDDYQKLSQESADWSRLPDHVEVTVFDRHLSEADAVAALTPFDAVCLLRERMAMPATLISRLPRLKFIAITGVKHRTLDVAAAHAQGIVISHTQRRGNGQYATVELAWGLILSLARHLPQEVMGMRAGGWQRSCGISLGGRTLGVLGLGRLGRQMVPIARAFGMEVIAWSQNMTAELAQECGATRVDKQTLFAESDFISLHVVLSERSRNIVDRAELEMMKTSAYLVNTARGPLINREALIESLAGKRIAGAALDTFDIEPLADDDALRGLDNIMLTPHLGYTVKELLVPFYEDTVENLLAYLAGKPLRVITA